ncbi:MAG: hypothetical protein ACLTSG_08020 [Lachnospiraceae bacterium]
MATEKMLRAVVSGPADRLDEAIRGLVLGMEFHPMPASGGVSGRGRAGRFAVPTGRTPAARRSTAPPSRS